MFFIEPLPVSLSRTQSGFSNAGPRIRPILRLEKLKYVLGESIRFWVGAEPQNSTFIAEELRKPCSLQIVRPNGSTKIELIGWPTDGVDGAGWTGGWGFGAEEVQAGKYTLELECAGETSQPIELFVERNELTDQIEAKFKFERAGNVRIGDPVSVLLTVQNNSQSTIRFPRRGSMEDGISLNVVRQEPRSTSAFFYPPEKLNGASTAAPDSYTWDRASDTPSVVLKPGEHFEQRLSLNDGYSFEGPGNYQITFATVLTVLVGQKDGEFRELCPIRFPVTATAEFVISDQI